MDQKCDTEKVQQAVSEVITQRQKTQTTLDEKLKNVVNRVDELSGESMYVRNRLDGVERRLGLEGQQQQAPLRDLQASVDQCRGDSHGLTRCSAEFQMDIQSRDQRHFEMEELIFKFSVELEECLKECREGLQCIRQLPESGAVSTSDHQEHAKAVQQVLDECRAQLVVHEKRFQDGERQTRRRQDELKAQRQQSKPEVHMGLCSEVQAAIETRFPAN